MSTGSENKSEVKRDLPIVQCASQAEWEAWLEAQHAASSGVWLKLAKKGSGIQTVSYAEAVESALCYGWIDGQSASHDDRFWLQRYTPRRRNSPWSRVNRDKATALVEQGRMKPAGLAQIEQAKQNGRWDSAYEAQSRATVPDDLQRALDQHPAAQAFFATLDSRNRYAILYRLHDAKKPETRARRVEQFIAMLEERRKLYP
jgi:uncharacterized protein YdeI (YjbR/CyaY-like superfamily)